MHNPEQTAFWKFQSQYTTANISYNVLFEALAFTSDQNDPIWILTIGEHPHQGRVQYRLKQDQYGKWQKIVGLNVLPFDQEDDLLKWAETLIRAFPPNGTV